MIFKNIVVPFDSSESARNALKQAVVFAQDNEAVQVHVISIMAIDTQTYMSYMSPFGGEAAYVDPEQIQELGEKSIMGKQEELEKSIDPVIAAVKEQVSVELIPGVSPADEIVAYAQEHDADCIIMGSRGLGAVRGMLGSVSYAVEPLWLRSAAGHAIRGHLAVCANTEVPECPLQGLTQGPIARILILTKLVGIRRIHESACYQREPFGEEGHAQNARANR